MKYKRIRTKSRIQAIYRFIDKYPNLQIIKHSKRYRLKGKYYFNIYYKRKPKPKKPKEMWRLTLAINYVIHHKYYSLVIQCWDTKKENLEKKIPELKEKLIELLEKKLDYKVDKGFAIDEESINIELEKVPYNKKLIGKCEERDENLGSKEKVSKEEIQKTLEQFWWL